MRAASVIPPDSLKALQMSPVGLSDFGAVRQLLETQEGHRLEGGAGSAADEASLRYQRALRNAVVHAPPDPQFATQMVSERQAPQPRTAREERVRRMAPPRSDSVPTARTST